jgi:protein ImuB
MRQARINLAKRFGEQADLPLVITDKVKGAQRLVAISPEARQAGLSEGLTLADARARIPDLWVEEAAAHADAELLTAIAEDCDRYTPVVVLDAPDGLLLDITGCTHLFGGEEELRKAFNDRLRRAGLHVRAVISSAPDAARALARYGRVAIVPPGEDAAAVRPLPIAALQLEENDRIAIFRAGLKTIGDIADRPSLAFAARFGEDMILRLRRVMGEAPTPLAPLRPTPMLWVERRFPEPIGRIEDIEAVLAALGYEAGERLAERREGGRVFEASFYRADGAVRRLAVEPGRPMRDARTLLRLFREKLDSLADPIDPGFGFDLIRLAIPITEPLEALQSGLDRCAVEADEIADLADRLAARFGNDRVMRFVPEDTHDPDRAARAVPAIFNPPAFPLWRNPEEKEPPLRPMFLFDPPQPVEAMAQVPDGPPLHFSWRRKKHIVARAEGPERIAPEWWRTPGAAARDYYRIEDSDGRRFWIFRVGFYGQPEGKPAWYVHGLFA